MEKIRGASIELDWGFMIFFFFLNQIQISRVRKFLNPFQFMVAFK